MLETGSPLARISLFGQTSSYAAGGTSIAGTCFKVITYGTLHLHREQGSKGCSIVSQVFDVTRLRLDTMHLFENLANNSVHQSAGSYLVCLLFAKTRTTSADFNKC